MSGEAKTITLTELDAVWFVAPVIHDCSNCGGTHTDVGFDRVAAYETRTANGKTAIVTHEARCPENGGVIFYGYIAPETKG